MIKRKTVKNIGCNFQEEIGIVLTVLSQRVFATLNELNRKRSRYLDLLNITGLNRTGTIKLILLVQTTIKKII